MKRRSRGATGSDGTAAGGAGSGISTRRGREGASAAELGADGWLPAPWRRAERGASVHLEVVTDGDVAVAHIVDELNPGR